MEFCIQAEGLAKATIMMLFAYKNTVNTNSPDNGSEFAQHELIAKKNERRFLFCTPIFLM
jgi:transposase, IS30 family